MPYANNKGADQPAHPRSLISTFTVCFLDNKILILAEFKLKTPASLCSRAGLFESYLVANPPEDRFFRDVAWIIFFSDFSPCMIANLWDVTDRDIDKYLQHLLTTWLASENGTLLSKVVQESRKACKMKYLVGCAPVVYGLPVVIKK